MEIRKPKISSRGSDPRETRTTFGNLKVFEKIIQLFSNVFLTMTPKGETTKEKPGKLDCIKILNSVHQKTQ